MTAKSNDMQQYADQLAVQMRKGTLAYCVLKVCGDDPVYTSDIAKRLKDAGMVIVEGTIYAILSRLQKDGLLMHEWKVSEQGPPRKYYRITDAGTEVRKALEPHIQVLSKTLAKLNEGKE